MNQEEVYITTVTACSEGGLERAKHLVEQDTGVSVKNNYVVCYLNAIGYIEVVKYPPALGGAITTEDNCAVRCVGAILYNKE